MKAVPGRRLDDPVFAKAKRLADSYEPAKRRPRSYRTGTQWLLPGKIRRNRGQALFVLPYDRLVARQALAVPVSDKGLLAVDRDAIKDAELMYLQVGDGALARAWPIRSSYSRNADADVPLATVIVPGVDFKPVDLAKLPAVQPGRKVVTRSVNLYRQMGTAMRVGRGTTGPNGTVKPAMFPGETTGAVFADDGTFLGFLTGRCDFRRKDFGASRMVAGAELAEWAKAAARSTRYRSSYQRGPTRKEDVPRPSAEGQAFILHVIAAEMPPSSVGK
jgi:hypothetical protein